MQSTLEGGTDAGSMAIFDPAALPLDFDVKYKKDPLAQLEQLTRSGHLYWLDTHADGSYRLGVYVRDSLPDHLRPFANQMYACDCFHVPSGRLYFTGIEYVFQSDDSSLRKYPKMGESTEVPAGSYRAEFFEFDYPEDFHEDLLQQRLSPAESRLFARMNTLAPLGCVGFLLMLGALANLKWGIWAIMILLCGLGLLALPIVLSRMPAYRKSNAVYREIQREFLDHAVLLRR
jgi:hypothetical protein